MIIKKINKYAVYLSLLMSFNLMAANENYSCSKNEYSFKECKFDVPEIKHGQTKLLSTDNGVFNGQALILCNNGTRSIISESCDYVQGAPDSCKGIPSNTWTGTNNSMCQHSSISISITNGEEYKVSSLSNNGFIKYQCVDTELKILSSDCTIPESSNKITIASTGAQCVSKSYSSNAQYNYNTKSWNSIPPNDTFCINEGFDYLNSYSDISTESNLNIENKGYFNAVCCANDTLDSPDPTITITPLSNDCATISGIISGDINDITGLASNNPSSLKVLNSMCKPNGYSTLENHSVNNATSGSYIFTDEFQVIANCCGNNSIVDNNTECKGAFLSAGINAETEAKSLGIPFICDSSGGSMECFLNTCTPFVSDAELCADCVLGTYSFASNANRCSVDFPVVLTGHESTQTFFNDTHSGYADVSCNNGISSLDDARCFNNCLNKRVTWENKSKTAVCYVDLPNSKYRHYLEPTDNDRLNPNLSIGDKTDRIISVVHTGVAEFHCDDGNWVENSEDLESPICFASCSAKTAMWGSGISKDGRDKTNACQASLPTQRHFLQPNFSSADGVNPMIGAIEDPLLSVTANGLNSGAAKFRCNDGSWEINGTQTCNLDCNAQTVSWTENGATASASVAANKHGTTLYNVVATSGTNIGKAENNKLTSSVTNLVCDDGRYIPVAPVVAEDCKAGVEIRNSANVTNACSFNWGVLGHTKSGTLISSTNSGSVNYVCNDGRMEFDANSLVCNASCSATTVEWARTSGLSSECLTGFVKIGGVCQRNSTVLPTCSSGSTFNTVSDQCESTSPVSNSYTAIASCDGLYADYDENGFSCQKTYLIQPKCPIGKYFDGSSCQSMSGASINETWNCPSNSTYYANYIAQGASSTPVSYSGTGCANCPTGSLELPLDNSNPNGTKFSYCSPNSSTWTITSTAQSYSTNTNGKAVCSIYNTGSASSGTYATWSMTKQATSTTNINYTDVCVETINQTPTCATGYTFNSTTGACTNTTLSAAQLSCPDTLRAKFTRMTTPNGISAYTRVLQHKNKCITDSIDGYCCISSEQTCSNRLDEENGICDWFVNSPTVVCPTGSSFDTVSKKCAIVSSKTATCNNGYILSGNLCSTIKITDATSVCPDGTAAPCSGIETSAATCSTITLDTGSTANPTFIAPFCQYTDVINNVATRTCPSGGTPIGNNCYNNSTKIVTSLPICSNGGTLNKSTNLCEATETMAPKIFEPINCSGSIGSGIHTTSGVSVIDSTQNGATGSATMKCVDGNWVASSSFCAKDCSPTITASTNSIGSMSWSTGESLPSDHIAYGLNCSTDNISMTNYAHSSNSGVKQTKNSGMQLIGNITYQCTDGTWNKLSSSCSRVTCSASTSSYTGLSTCRVNVPNMKWGDIKTVDQPLGFSGTTDAIYTCGDSGTATLSNSPDCNADCNITANNNSYLWSAEYSGCFQSNSNYLDHLETISIKDTDSSQRGSVNLVCNNGIISKNGEVCRKATLRNTTVYWNNTNGTNGTSGSCSATLPNDIMLGGASYGATDCVSVSNASSSFLGSATICATATGMIKTSGTCNASCNATSVNWSNCSGTTSSRTHGGSVSVTDGASGSYTGSATATCNNGNWSLTNTSCAATCSTTPYTPNCGSGFSYNSTSKMCISNSGSSSWSSPDLINSFGNQRGQCETDDVTDYKTGACSGGTYRAEVCVRTNDCRITAPYMCNGGTQTCGSSIAPQTPTCPSGANLVNGMCVNSCNSTPPVTSGTWSAKTQIYTTGQFASGSCPSIAYQKRDSDGYNNGLVSAKTPNSSCSTIGEIARSEMLSYGGGRCQIYIYQQTCQ